MRSNVAGARLGSRGRRRAARRGAILLATFVVIVIATITAGSIVQTTTVQRMGLAASGARAQSRALAWSGVLGAMNELGAQREELLRGGVPELTTEWVVYEEEGGERGVVRLRLIGQLAATPEAARLDLNSATPEMLAALAGIGEAGAQRIVSARDEALFGSVAEALAASKLGEADSEPVAPVEEILPEDAGSEEGAALEVGSGTAPAPGDLGEVALAELVTVFSADPAVQAGIGPEGNRSAGEACIAVGEPWDEQTRRSLERRFAPAVLDALQPREPEEGESEDARAPDTAPGAGEPAPREPPATTAELIERVRSAGLQPESLAEALDALSVSAGEFRFGRIDILRAPEAVLRCIPGVDEAAAAAIVERRDSLDEELRLSAAWLLTEGLLTEEAFRKAAEHVTTRCLQWRVVVEAGIEDGSRPGDMGSDLGEPGAEAAPLRHRVALEAVIDVAGERPRVAYLRDVTLLDAAAAVAALGEEEGRDEAGGVFAERAGAGGGLLTAPDSADAGANADDDLGEGPGDMTDLNLDGLDLETDLDGEAPDPSATNNPRTPPDGADPSPPEPSRGRIGRWRSR